MRKNWAYLLQENLRSEGLDAKVFNAGVPGYTSYQGAIDLRERLPQLKPQIVIDRIFYKGKYDYQKTIKRVSQLIVSVLDYEEIGKLLMDTIVDTMKVRHCALFLRDASGSSFLDFSIRGEPIDQERSILINKDTGVIKFMKNQRRPVMRKNLKQKISSPKISDVLKDMDGLGAEIVFPMIFEENLNGFIVLGEKLSGERLR